MDSRTLIEQLEPKIGREAARIGVQSRFNRMVESAIGLATLALLKVTPNREYAYVFTACAAALVFVLVIDFRAKWRLSRLISKHLRKKVSWYSVPNVMPVATFERWLEKVKDQAGS